jgi:hypothetical protein
VAVAAAASVDVVDSLRVEVCGTLRAVQNFLANVPQDAVEWELLSDPQTLLLVRRAP